MKGTGPVNKVVLSDARYYIQHWFEVKKLTVKEAETNPIILNKIFLDYEHDYRAFKAAAFLSDSKSDGKMPPLHDKKLQYAYQEYIVDQAELEQNNFIKNFSGFPEDLAPIKTWVKAVTGDEDPNHIAVMAHWCWMVKRKANKLPVKHHVMPVVFSIAQGTGKTMAITKLIEPLSSFRLLMNPDKLGDDKLFESMGRNFIVFFDEMQGIERADLNVLKNQITTEYNSYRRMYTHNVAQVAMNCSFIGASNRPLNEMIFDTTGMRRFFEVPSLARCDWAAVNTLDYTSLWRGIDETNSEGYLSGDRLAAVQELQKDLVVPDDLEDFLRENYVRPVPGGDAEERTATSMFLTYQEWCAFSGVKKPLSRSGFVKKLKNRKLLWSKVRETVYFRVNKEATKFNTYKLESSNVRSS